ncbi:uncharacterized protein LTR77_004208 [Saxophila tyrrhenica]|uniref:Uncharacterized protein n=1 Tax=Saxophila tyrrhenica TaxID=1690608 RepID=A0AAV9PC06_9PEZI|nr:hypothetical protein LTR77_004208 [Saxophila tyrrhenica]
MLNKGRSLVTLQQPPMSQAHQFPQPVATLAVHPQTQSNLFKLPPELRNAVYAFALKILDGHIGSIELAQRKIDHNAINPARSPPPATSLLQTCKIIESEARLLFFAVNHLRLDSFRMYMYREGRHPSKVRDAALIDGPATLRYMARLSAIERITITVGSIGSLGMRRFKNLKELHFDINANLRCTNCPRYTVGPNKRVWNYEELSKEFEAEQKDLRDAVKQLPIGIQTLQVHFLLCGKCTKPNLRYAVSTGACSILVAPEQRFLDLEVRISTWLMEEYQKVHVERSSVVEEGDDGDEESVKIPKRRHAVRGW